MQERSFVRRILVVTAVLGVLLLVVVLFRSAATMLLVVFAGVLLAVLLEGLAGLLRHRTPLPRGAALAVVVVVLAGALAAFVFLAGPHVAAQMDQLGERVPQAVDGLGQRLRQYAWGRALIEQMPEPAAFLGSDARVAGRVTSLLSHVAGGLTGVLVVLFLGIYLAADPKLYVVGALRLVPPERRQQARDLIHAQANALRHWLAGQFAAMTIVGTLSTVGLYLLGIPLALVLGLIAGLLNFIPYVGPFLSFFPALLVALTEGPQPALYVAALFAGIQLVESYVITPLIQKKAVSLPPALLLTAQLFGAALLGPVGMAMAAPLAVVGIVAVQVLYVRGVLGEDVRILGT